MYRKEEARKGRGKRRERERGGGGGGNTARTENTPKRAPSQAPADGSEGEENGGEGGQAEGGGQKVRGAARPKQREKRGEGGKAPEPVWRVVVVQCGSVCAVGCENMVGNREGVWRVDAACDCGTFF